MNRLFVETEVFRLCIDDEGKKGLERVIKDAILRNPKAGAIIQGTGGVRKLRVPEPGIKGKSGAYRVLYLDLPGPEVVYLFLIYEKSVKESISQRQKRAIKKAVEEIKNEWI